MLYDRPDLLHRVLHVNAQAVSAYLNAQVDAGAQALMLFDTWGGALASGAYEEFSLAYLEEVLAHLRRSVDGRTIPVILYARGAGGWLEKLRTAGADAIGLDWTVDLADARRRLGPDIAIQGNLDPAVLFANPAVIRREVRKVLDSAGTGAGHVFNLGHGISQFTPPEHVGVLVDSVHDLSARSPVSAA
jgi:uroporphyrinogen decarboxylase